MHTNGPLIAVSLTVKRAGFCKWNKAAFSRNQSRNIKKEVPIAVSLQSGCTRMGAAATVVIVEVEKGQTATTAVEVVADVLLNHWQHRHHLRED